jgi:hypothetical protein
MRNSVPEESPARRLGFVVGDDAGLVGLQRTGETDEIGKAALFLAANPSS